MKSHELKYLVGEGCRNAWQNRLMVLASTGVLICCLLLTGFAYLLFVNVDQMFQNAYEQNVVAVYLDADQDDAEAEAIGNQIRNMSNIASADFLSKEEFLKRYGGSLQENTLESFEGENNPLPDTYIVSLKDLSLFDQTLDKLEAINGVEEVSYDADTAQTLAKVRRVVLAVGGSVIVVLLVVSLFIIVNTIKLTVYNRRLEIYIMKSVGATDGFVRFPFVVEGLLVGVVAGSVGYGLMAGLYILMLKNFAFNNPLLTLVPFEEQWWPLLVGFMLGGMLVGVCGSVISMSRYLKHEGGLHS